MGLNILVWSVLIICSGLSCFCIGMLNSYRKDIAKDRKELEIRDKIGKHCKVVEPFRTVL